MNQVTQRKSKEVAGVCVQQPMSMEATCKSVADSIVKSKDLKYIMIKGCIDTTTIAPTELPANSCSGLVACNLIETDSGGPWCGTYMGQYGRMTQGAGSESQQAEGIFD